MPTPKLPTQQGWGCALSSGQLIGGQEEGSGVLGPGGRPPPPPPPTGEYPDGPGGVDGLGVEGLGVDGDGVDGPGGGGRLKTPRAI